MKLNAKTITVGLITLSVLLISACHTIEGAGRDLESAGDAAEKVTRRR